MDAAFHRLAALSRPVVNRVHGDEVMVYPVTRTGGPNGGRTISAASAYGATACFFENTLIENDAMSRPLTGSGRLMHAEPNVAASITLVDGKDLAAGYYMQRTRDGAVFEIGPFKPDGNGGVYAALNYAAALPEMI